MYNCIKLLRNNELFAIVRYEYTADTIIKTVYASDSPVIWNKEWAYIEGIGF